IAPSGSRLSYHRRPLARVEQRPCSRGLQRRLPAQVRKSEVTRSAVRDAAWLRGPVGSGRREWELDWGLSDARSRSRADGSLGDYGWCRVYELVGTSPRRRASTAHGTPTGTFTPAVESRGPRVRGNSPTVDR